MAGLGERIVVGVMPEMAVVAVPEIHCEKTQTSFVSLLVDVCRV